MRETTKVTAICNQKGGVGKTVTAVNLGIGLVREGKRVLLVDIDPKCRVRHRIICRKNSYAEDTGMGEKTAQKITIFQNLVEKVSA